MSYEKLFKMLAHFGFQMRQVTGDDDLRSLAGSTAVIAALDAEGDLICQLPKLLTTAVIQDLVNTYQDRPLRFAFVKETSDAFIYRAEVDINHLEGIQSVLSFLQSGMVQAFRIGNAAYVYPAEIVDMIRSAGSTVAMDALQKAAMTSKDAVLLNYAGKVAQERGHADEAARYFVDACQALPQFAEAHSNMGALMWGQNHQNEGFNLFIEALIRNPADLHIQDNFIMAGNTLEKYEEMNACLLKCQEFHPDYQGLTYLRALILLRLGQVAESRVLASRLLQDNPADIRAQKLLEELQSIAV